LGQKGSRLQPLAITAPGENQELGLLLQAVMDAGGAFLRQYAGNMGPAVRAEPVGNAGHVQRRIESGIRLAQCGIRANCDDCSRAMRADARSLTLSLLSWPQAAMMSRPRGVLTGEA